MLVTAIEGDIHCIEHVPWSSFGGGWRTPEIMGGGGTNYGYLGIGPINGFGDVNANTTRTVKVNFKYNFFFKNGVEIQYNLLQYCTVQ